ncbi:MAG: hypothetical protein IH921_00175 [Gemmatimonadetes bacterium]|nr:hypothetical protein [Gemmatimonadota bacterium]
MARQRNPVLAIVTNPPAMSEEVQSINYRHADDGIEYVHQFGAGVTMQPQADGSVQLRHSKDRPLHEKVESGQRFLINPPRRASMASKRLPPRVKSGKNKGQFRKRATAKRKSPAKKRRRNMPMQYAAAANKPNPRHRNNPPRRGKFTVRKITRSLTTGAMDALLVIVGKAGARTIPAMLPNLPKEGNMGLAIQALTAVVLGLGAEMVLSPAQAKIILAGALTAPIETLVVAMNVPFLAPALAPVTLNAQLSAYMGSYVQPPLLPPEPNDNSIGAYVQEGADAAMQGFDYALDA